MLLGLLASAAVAAVLLAGIALAVAYPNLPEIDSLTDYRPKLPMRVFSADGVLLGEFGEERRNFVPIQQIPKVMQDAVLAAEDAKFYQHSGVNYVSVVRAGLANFGEARNAQGASTITMQVARNFYLSTEKTFIRKIYEMLLSLKIESLLTKEQILEVYMNHIALGQRAYGFASASEIYFGKPLKDITVAEAAMLAGLPKAPSANNPIVNPQRATIRQRYILERMLENGFITQEQRDAALKQVLKYRAPTDVAVHAEYVAEAARQMIFSQYGPEAYTRGLNVYLTLNSAEQTLAYHALRKGIMDYEKRQVYRGPEDYIDLPADKSELDARISEALQDFPDNDELSRRGRHRSVAEEGRRDAAERRIGHHRRRRVEARRFGAFAQGQPEDAAASGRGRAPGQRRQGRRGRSPSCPKSKARSWRWTRAPAASARWSAASTTRRASSTTSLRRGASPDRASSLSSTRLRSRRASRRRRSSTTRRSSSTPATTGSQPWEPKNYDGTFDGPMTMRRGLAKSKNMISIRILKSIGPAYAQQWIKRFGFDADKHPAYLPMALGAGAVTPLQMASAYSVFANGGYRVNPLLISRITDARGHVVNEARVPTLDESARTIDARNAFVMTSLLQEVTHTGTAAKAGAALKRPDIYGKTGTTNDSHDAWFAGWQKNIVAVVWMGYDKPQKLGDRETGGGLALPVWIDYMATMLKGVPFQEPTAPEGVVNVGGEWYYDEYARGAGVSSLGLDDKAAPTPPSDEERNSILDLFRR